MCPEELAHSKHYDDFSDLLSFSHDELAVINQILIAILHSTDFETLLDSMYKYLSWEIDLQSISIYMLIEDSQNLKKVCSQGETSPYLPDIINHKSDLCSIIINNNFSSYLPNKVQLSLFENQPDCLHQTIMVDYKLIGTIACIYRNGNPNLLKVVLAQAASALELLYKTDSITSSLSMRTHFKEDSSPFHLTTREIEVLKLISSGLSNKEISEKLFISISTCKHHVQSILEKLEIHNRASAAAYYITHSEDLLS